MNATAETTWMCDNGYHGTNERRFIGPDRDWSGMFTGKCAGSVFYHFTDKGQVPCSCECHNKESKA